ncbi:hypothetical protein [Azorhizophilus paspali]|uniref:Uncharacterized protein n=1 Tax=Azorhizophilus paspali TaxID=69963 RepID=A0ABV6SHM6_AZOPA
MGSHSRTDGDDLTFAPEVSASLWATYRLPFGLTVGGGLQHTSPAYLGRPDDANRIIANGLCGKLPSYLQPDVDDFQCVDGGSAMPVSGGLGTGRLA